MAIIDMQAMRYINLLDKVSNVKTRRCFIHNNTIFFAVNRKLVSRAIGSSAVNIKKIQEQIGKKVKIINEPSGREDTKRFIQDIVSPVKFKSQEIKDGTLIITAGNNQSKASLIGRDKRRFEELKKIVQDFFSLDLKII
jgi:NusA-like KH domain protein